MELRINKILRLSILFVSLSLLSSCYVTRSIFWYPTGIHDQTRFPADSIRNQPPFSDFKESHDTQRFSIHGEFLISGNHLSFEDVLADSHTLAFLVIRNDSLLFSKYFGGYSESSAFPSFSVAKSFVSALTGIAISEGFIKSVDQPVTDFFPELKNRGFGKVTLRHLLTMRSGLNFNEGYKNPFGDDSRIYYGRHLKKFIFRLKVTSEPGAAYSYQSANTQLVALVLEKATGKRLSEYMEEKIWKPLGMKYPATWSVDGKHTQEAKAFCCINATAPDFARFGQLFLDHGSRAGRTIIPEQWVKESLTIQNDSKDSRGYPYTYFWRVRNDGEFFAYGVLGQYIYVCPSKHVVIVRIGDKAGGIDWPGFFHLIMQQL